MANYNILMNRFNGTTHDTLLPKNSLEGTTDPTTSTKGIVGQFYLNTTTKQLFQCTVVSGSVYTWNPYYNAEQVLNNDTKAKYGLPNTATPDDAFNSLATNMVATRKTYPIAAGNTVVAGDVVDVVGGEVFGRVKVGTLPVGTTIGIKESGVLAEYIIVHQGKPSSLYDASCDGTWVLRKDTLAARQWNSAATNGYATSTINTYLNGQFLSLLDTSTASGVKQVKIPYRTGNSGSSISSGANGLSCKVFLMSAYELGFTTTDLPVIPIDGAKLAFFYAGVDAAAKSRRASNSAYWTRSPKINETNGATFINANGDGNYATTTITYGVRPAMVLDTDFAVLPNSRAQAIALQSGTAGNFIDIIYDGVAKLPGITAGTQITSAGVFGYAPQDGWLWVRPYWDADPYVVGGYTGNGAASRTISLGFTPSVVLVLATQYNVANMAITPTQIAMARVGLDGPGLSVVTGGFSITPGNTNAPGLNYLGKDHNYIAFK